MAPVHRRSARRLSTVGWVGAILLAIAGSSQAASRPIEVENLWIGFGSTNSFKVGTWTPVWVQLKAGDARFEGFMEVAVADDDGTPVSYFTRVDVGAKTSQGFPAYIRPGARDPDLTIRLYDRDQRRVATITQEAVLPQPPLALTPQETMILALGRAAGVEALSQLPGFKDGTPGSTAGNSASGEPIVVTRIDPRLGRLPGRWYGYDAARAIVVDTADPEVVKSLDGLRAQPLVDWVKRGGHLVITVGANWQAVKDSVLGPILPGVPTGQVQLASLDAFDAFAGSIKPITPPGSPKVMVTKIDETAERGGTVLVQMSRLPLVVRGHCGFGRVTLIALDVDNKLFSDWPDRGQFWARAIDLRPQRADQTGANVMIGGPGRFNRWAISDLAGQLRAALEQFPGVRLIPFGWVAFFIFLYILLIGPGDYFFLKKVLKRMELTWITFPTIVVAVSLLAYYAAYMFKGNDLLINQVDVVDVDQVAGVQRGTTWAGLFSPQNRDYTMRVLPLPLDGPPPPAETSTGGELARPSPGTEVVMSWFSSPEDQFGAMGNSSRRFSFGNGGYAYGSYADRGAEPASGAVESLQGVRIPIWSTKCVIGRWFGPVGPMIDSDIRPVGTDRLQGTVTNRLDIPLEDAMVAFSKHVYLVGKIGPRATIRVELAPSDRDLAGYLKDKRKSYIDQTQADPDFRIDRSALMLDAMFHDSETQVGNERALTNNALYGLDLTGQLVLPRPMLVARVSRPGSRLILDNPPSPPKVEQTTLLRVILPIHEGK
jgi:hypothetical protein